VYAINGTAAAALAWLRRLQLIYGCRCCWLVVVEEAQQHSLNVSHDWRARAVLSERHSIAYVSRVSVCRGHARESKVLTVMQQAQQKKVRSSVCAAWHWHVSNFRVID